MSKYAKINSENIVENVIVCDDSNISTFDGVYIKVTSGTMDANVGQSYDASNNKFIPSKPYPSWILGEDFKWHAPTGCHPSDGAYEWDEENQEWNELIPGVVKDQTHRWDVELEDWVPLS